MEKADSDKLLAQLCEESEQLMVRLNVAIVGCNLPEKLPRLLVTESVNTVDAVVQQFGYDAVSSNKCLKRCFRHYACLASWR